MKIIGGHVFLIGGLSLGGQVLLEILSRKNDICDYAIIESALATPIRFTHKIIGPAISMSYGLISKKWFAKMQFKSLRIREDLFDDYYRDTCKITKKDLISFMKANSNYELKSSICSVKTKVLVVVGEKERRVLKDSANVINQAIKGSQIKLMTNYHHGDLSINHPSEYVEIIQKLP